MSSSYSAETIEITLEQKPFTPFVFNKPLIDADLNEVWPEYFLLKLQTNSYSGRGDLIRGRRLKARAVWW